MRDDAPRGGCPGQRLVVTFGLVSVGTGEPGDGLVEV
jgi:hypothetical protein